MKFRQATLLLSIFGLLIILQACEEATDWDYQTGDNGKLVVEAIITNQQDRQEIKLSRSFDDINGLADPVTGAIVSINNGQINVPFIEESNSPGIYRIAQAGAAQMGTTYELVIEWNDQRYTATSSMVQVFPFGNPSFASADDSINMKLVSTPDLYSTIEQAMYEIDIDWSAISNELPNTAKQIFYTFKTIDVNEVFKSQATKVKFPRGSRVIITKYGLNDDFAAYLRALVMETEWQGSPFDEAPSSLPTNISDGGLGYFGVCAIRRDTFLAE